MKLIIGNRYLKTFKFSSSKEAKNFLDRQGSKPVLDLKETFGDNYFCYVCYHSLTSESLFILTFSSDIDEESLNFLFWDKHELLVLDTGEYIYLIDGDLSIVAFFEVTTPLVGLFLISENRLLILEEAFLRLVDSEGRVIKSELFDLMVDFSLNNNYLIVKTDEGEKSIKLV